MKNALEKFRNKIEEELDLEVLGSRLNKGVFISRELLFDIISPSSKLLVLQYEAANSIKVNSADASATEGEYGEWDTIVILNIPQEYRYSKVHAPHMTSLFDEYSMDNIRTYLLMTSHKDLYKEMNE